MKRLFPKALVSLLLILGSLFAAPCWAETKVFLNANFNDKPLGMPIGTGGPTVGEPIFVHPSLVAKVQAGFLPTPSLEISHSTGANFDSVVFEFPGQAVVRDGDLRIAFTVRASSANAAFRILISEPGSSLRNFGTLDFTALGAIDASDATGPSPSLATYLPGSTVKIEYLYHMDARTYDLRINNALAFGNRPHGITAPGVGIGRLVFATNKVATNQNQAWGLDDLFVTRSTLLLDANFNDKVVNSPIGTAGASRGEPTSVANALAAIVRATPFSTKSLHFSQSAPAANNIARFELLGGAQIRRGELHVGFTVHTPAVFDTFRARMLERTISPGLFGGIQFTNSGVIETLDGLNGNEGFFNYTPNTTYRIELVYQAAAGTYDIYVDGKVRLGRAKHSVTDPERGFGAIDFSLTGNSSQEWVIDDVRVEHKPMLLDADFNLQSLNQQIGSGGALAGQPVFVSPGLSAEIRPFQFLTPSLALQQATTGATRSANFEFIKSAEVKGGELRIGMRVLPPSSNDSFNIDLSAQGSSMGDFGSLTFQSNGNIRTYDASGNAVVSTYAPFVEQQFEFRYRFDEGRYDVYVDRVLKVSNRPIPSGRGIGRISLQTTIASTGRWIVEDLYAYRVNDSIFETGFDCDGCE